MSKTQQQQQQQQHFLNRSKQEEEADVELFKEFLRMDTQHPIDEKNQKLRPCCEWLERVAKELEMKFQIVECHPGLPNVILTLEGEDPQLPSLLLNCHMDVVPVVPSMWNELKEGETPFSAWENPENGRIYARGSQDMKCCGAQYLCAIRHVKNQNPNKKLKFKRTVHLLFVPDEEIGGPQGMGLLIKTQEFRDLNIGLALDEGLAFDSNRFVIFYGERTPIWVTFIAKGVMGHGAKLLENTANDRLARVVERMTKKRDDSFNKVHKQNVDLGEVTSFNWTAMHSGVTTDGGKTYAYNVIPRNGSVTFDVRIALPDYEGLIADWQKWAEELDLTVQFERGNKPQGPSPYSPTNSQWFNLMKKTLKDYVPEAELDLRCFPAATDSRYLRRAGIPAYGFSPMRNIPSLLHDHNEYRCCKKKRESKSQNILFMLITISACVFVTNFTELLTKSLCSCGFVATHRESI